MIFILGIFQIAVGCITANIFPIQPLGLQGSAGLLRYILGIVVIDDVFQRYGQFVLGLKCSSIIMVIDGDKADTEFRTNPLQEVACLNIIAAQAGQVFLR